MNCISRFVIQFCHCWFPQYLLIYHSQILIGEVQKCLQFRNLFIKDNLLFDNGIEHQQQQQRANMVWSLKINITNINLFLRMNILGQGNLIGIDASFTRGDGNNLINLINIIMLSSLTNIRCIGYQENLCDWWVIDTGEGTI